MRTLAALAAVSALLVSSTALADVDQMRSTALGWLVSHQRGDGRFESAQGLDVQATAAAAEAMRAGGLQKSPQYARAVSWLANAKTESLDAKVGQIEALNAAGRDVTTLATAVKDARKTVVAVNGVPTSGVAMWGPFEGYRESIPDTALGYGALRISGASYTNDTTELTVTTLCQVLPAQLGAAPWAGAWADALQYTTQPAHQGNGSAMATARMLYELKAQRQASRFLTGSACGKSSPAAIDAAMSSAKSWLITQANSNGGFAERDAQTGVLEASNPVVTAYVVRALDLFAAEGDSAAASAIASAYAWLETASTAGGGWLNDPFATARVLAALPVASGTQVADADGDGLTDVVEVQVGTNLNVADAQTLLATDAHAGSGVTAAAFSADAVLGEPFGYALTASGGTGPYQFVLTSGALPPGLSLTANGEISGTPSATGHYAFDYEVTDSVSTKALVIGRIDVAAAIATDAGDGDVPLPAWALALLGGALLSAIRKQHA